VLDPYEERLAASYSEDAGLKARRYKKRRTAAQSRRYKAEGQAGKSGKLLVWKWFRKRRFCVSSWDPVYKLVKQIPRGRVTTYGALAKALRLRGGARTAGRAMAATPSSKGIPWHRVVGYGGKLLIREPYSSLQRKLLESEGVRLLEFRVDLKSHLWTPGKSGKARVIRKAAPKRRSKERR
jgi:methylated-DNA-protein-cysteine methyltransferase related protein